MVLEHLSHGLRTRSPNRKRNRNDFAVPHFREDPHQHKTGHSNKRHRHSRSASTQNATILPFGAPQLVKHQLNEYRALFASYLDIQKQLEIDELDESEVKGRWKSFVGKWNRGDLAEGWYDPSTKRRIDEADHSRASANPGNSCQSPALNGEDDEDDYGPQPARNGAQVPTLEDLAVQDEMAAEDAVLHRQSLQVARKTARKDQRDLLEELIPRAEPGSKERAIEKKREAGVAATAYRESATGGCEMEEVGEKDLMGDGDDLKTMKKQHGRRKNERELRREEALRARAEEREQKARGLREKEQQTMERLQALARRQYG